MKLSYCERVGRDVGPRLIASKVEDIKAERDEMRVTCMRARSPNPSNISPFTKAGRPIKYDVSLLFPALLIL